MQQGTPENNGERITALPVVSSRDALYRDVFDAAPFGYVLTNLAGIIQETNRAAALMLGVRQDALTGKPLVDFVAEEGTERLTFNACLARLQAGQTNEAWAVRLRSAEGGSFYAAANVSTLPDARATDGTPRLCWVLRDITRPKRTEGMLWQSEQQLRGIFENSADGISLVDARGEVVEWNHSMERITGLTRENVLGRFYGDVAAQLIADPELAERTRARKRTRLTDPSPWQSKTVEVEIRRSDRTRCVVQQTVFPIHTEDGPMFGSIVRDVTERREMENTLRRANEQLDARVQERTIALTQAVQRLQDEIAHRRAMESSLRDRVRIEKIISAISNRFVTLATDQVEREIHAALRLVGEFSGVDRAHVSLLSDTGTVFAESYEWCAEGIEAHAVDALRVSPELVALCLQAMRQDAKIHVPRVADMSDLPGEAGDLLRQRGVQSFILVPMLHQGKLIGVLGFDAVRAEKTWLAEDITLLQVVAEIFANALEHHRAERVLRESESRQAVILNTVPVILYAFRMNDGVSTMTWISPNAKQITGFPPNRFVDDPRFWFARIHPDDQAQVMEQLRDLAFVSRSVEYRWQCADGSYHWFLDRVDGVTQDNATEYVGTWLDITKRKRAEEAEHAQRVLAEVLRDTAESFSNMLDADQVLTSLLANVERIVPCDGANVMLVKDGLLRVMAWHGYADLPKPNLEQGLLDLEMLPSLQKMFANGQPQLVPDTATDEHWVTWTGMSWIRSYIGMPIRALSKTIGFLNVDSATPHFFNPTHVERLKAITGQASVALSNAHLFAETRQKADRLRVLSQRLVEAQEIERARIARELHDEIGQILTALMVDLHYVERHAQEPDSIRARAADAKRLTNNALEGLHQLVVDLHPTSLEYRGLVPALRQYIDGFVQQFQVPVEFDDMGLGDVRLPDEVETALYRIVQEALTNVARHAHAQSAQVLFTQREGWLSLLIWDDGVGFDPNGPALSNRLGLVGMRERAEMLGGRFSVESDTGIGTTLRVEVPYVRANSNR
ncbi:MAG: PAS domain S-box protein [Chloroflexi bacterium]|nr:PAS domain S-box protein [Chloroflexota bacterium]